MTIDTAHEIAVEDHRFFLARLRHLQSRNPAMLLHLLEEQTLTLHLRLVTMRAMTALGALIIHHGKTPDHAEELVMHCIVADPTEWSTLPTPLQHKLLYMLDRYTKMLPGLSRTYLSENETII